MNKLPAEKRNVHRPLTVGFIEEFSLSERKPQKVVKEIGGPAEVIYA